jgi:hypothetical protein
VIFIETPIFTDDVKAMLAEKTIGGCSKCSLIDLMPAI